jgi:hypothetical protein
VVHWISWFEVINKNHENWCSTRISGNLPLSLNKHHDLIHVQPKQNYRHWRSVKNETLRQNNVPIISAVLTHDHAGHLGPPMLIYVYCVQHVFSYQRRFVSIYKWKVHNWKGRLSNIIGPGQSSAPRPYIHNYSQE